jgi:hypothetical protein
VLAEMNDSEFAVGVSYELAEAYARSIGRRLPTQAEWSESVVEPTRKDIWEWTSTGTSHLVRGGPDLHPLRQRLSRLLPSSWAPKKSSEEASPAGVGFRCVLDLEKAPGRWGDSGDVLHDFPRCAEDSGEVRREAGA